MTVTFDNVQAELEEVGEIIVTMESGERYELHLWDTIFQEEAETIRVETAEGYHLLDGGAVENIEIHHSHKL